MFSGIKTRGYLGLFLGIFIGMLGIGYTSAVSFEDRLSDIGLNVGTFSDKNSISRYEISRLLASSNCEDCVQAPEWMKNLYTRDFWSAFKDIDGNNFDDIDFEGAVWNKNSYYYCVAYVGDSGYMGGYPSTSVKCQGKFCGQELVTTSEFYQMVLNITQDQIRPRYRINWVDVKSWLKGLKKDSIQRKVLTQGNVDAINNADSENQTAQTNEEFQAWLKYCMYNLGACDFQNFGAIGTGYWPVSELNVLYKEGIITMEDAMATVSSPYLKGEEAIRIFSAVYDNYSNCSFNVDYDCDGIVNGKDNCPYMYNPNQYDLDGDGQGNVCDQDADGDGEKNPVGIVDDNNHIVISLWDKKLDETPLGDGDLGFSFFINVDAISTGFPTAVRFAPLTNGDIVKVERDFGDGNKQVVDNSGKVNHVFQTVGNFTVSAVATSKDGSQAFAMSKIFIANPKSEDYMLNLSASALFKNGNIEYTLTPLYEGNLDTIRWSVNGGEEVIQKVSENFKTIIKDDGLYIVNAKGYVNGELKAVAMLSIVKDGTPAYAAMNLRVGDLWNKSSVITNLVGVDSNSVSRVNVNWGDSSTYSNNLSQSYVYEEAGIKTIQQSVVLKNGITLNSMATISIQNPLLTQSYAVNINGDRLAYNQNEKLALGLNVYPKSPVLSLFTSYQAGYKNFIYNPDLSKTVLDFSYVTAGDKLLTNSVGVNRCVALTNQGTLHVKPVDACLSALKNGKLSQYKCDMDGDSIPDICDDDIDGDGIKNLIGIVSYENKDCSMNSNNVNASLFKQQFGVCSLDNCPFDSNSNQSDLDNDGVGDICGTEMFNFTESSGNTMVDAGSSFLENDMDQDGIIDSLDACVNVPGNSADGCPDYYTRNCRARSNCGNNVVDAGETCLSCPQDVGDCCGNGVFDYGESCRTCPGDSGECSLCGNGKIDNGENCENCPEDLGACSGVCGNGQMDRGETCWNCPKDLGACTTTCGNKKVDDGENCENCPEDVGKCSASCGNGKIEKAETCENCPEDVEMCKKDTCGDGKVDELAGEECDSGKDKNGNIMGCTKMCTKYNPSKPLCGNGEVDDGEDCKNCPVDLGDRCIKSGSKDDEKCGNGDIDDGETCLNCPEDVGKCSASCGNGKIEDAEDCENCPKDVGVCSASCGNGKIEKAEDCVTCPEDVKMCRSNTCGNGKVDGLAGEECDSGKDKDGNAVECTKMCTIYNPKEPLCGNGKIDYGEDCKNCSVDLGEKCIKSGKKTEKKCGNNNVDEGETCKNCPEDVGKCTATCGDKNIQDAEDCENCSKDVGVCTASCGNGKIEKAETCENCPEDVKMCKSDTCGNGKVDESAGEECDSGKDKDGNAVECTKMCTIYDSSKPLCGNGDIDDGEDCEECSVDLGDKCIKSGNKISEKCGNGEKDEGEQCDPNDSLEDGWGSDGCSSTCKQIDKNSGKCNPNYDGKFLESLINTSSLCLRGTLIDFSFNANRLRWTWSCKNEETGISIGCMASRSYCGNGEIDKGEICDNCSQDLKERCIDGCDVEFSKYPLTECPEGAICSYVECKGTIRYKIDKCQVDYKLDDGKCVCDKFDNGIESCTSGCPCADLNDCPSELKKHCENLCGNGEIDKGEICDNCSQDLKEICIDVCTKDFEKYPLIECPEGAICSYVECGGTYRYKIDKCEGDYELIDGTCQCEEEYTQSAVMDGTYSCSCPYEDLCFLQVGLNKLCNGNGYCDTKSYMGDTQMNYVYFILDDDWAKAAGIDDIDSIWDKREGLDGAGNVISVLENYMSPANCEEIGQKYFSEEGKELSVIHNEGKECTQVCPCVDLDNCPEDLKEKCDIEDEEDCDCSTCPEKLGEACLGRPAPDVPEPNGDDGNGGDDGDGDGWDVSNGSCNSCPCEYADFSADLVKGDSIRAKLWDKSLSAFYRYSNSVAVDSLMNSGGEGGSGGGGGGGGSSSPSNNNTEPETKKAKLIVRRNGEKTIREYLTPLDRSDLSIEKNSTIWAQFKNLIGK